MNLFLGTDICEIYRIQNLLDKYGDKFLKKIFTENEIKYAMSKKFGAAASLSARYAAKEAVSKALGVGLNGIGWSNGIDFSDVEVLRLENGSIYLSLHNKAKFFEEKCGIKQWTISFSHGKDYAVATVIGYDSNL